MTAPSKSIIDWDSLASREASEVADFVITLSKKAQGDVTRSLSGNEGTIMTLADIDLTEPTVVIPGFAYGGQVTMVHGKPGSGKSTLARQAIRCVVTGEPFLGKPVMRGSTLLYAVDEGLRHAVDTLVNKMNLPIDREEDGQAYAKEETPPVGMAAPWLHRNLNLHPEIRLVVIDTLQTFFRLKDVNDNSEVDSALQGLREVANRHPDTAFVLVHHAGKSGGYMGATTISGKVDLMYRMEKDEDAENVNHLVNEKHRTIAAQPKADLRWNSDTWSYDLAADYRSVKVSQRADERRERITEQLKQHSDGLRKRALHELVKGKWDIFSEMLAAMVADGTVTQKDDLYVLTGGE